MHDQWRGDQALASPHVTVEEFLQLRIRRLRRGGPVAGSPPRRCLEESVVPQIADGLVRLDRRHVIVAQERLGEDLEHALALLARAVGDDATVATLPLLLENFERPGQREAGYVGWDLVEIDEHQQGRAILQPGGDRYCPLARGSCAA